MGNRVWVIEGCNGIGKHLEHRLVHDGEVVLDVPAKLAAQVRVLATSNTPQERTRSMRTRWPWPRCTRRTWFRVEVDADLVVRMLVDRRDELGRARTQTVNRLHRLLLELFPGVAKKFSSAAQARALITTNQAP